MTVIVGIHVVGALPAGAQSIRVEAPTLVALATPQHSLYEPQLAIDPREPNRWLAVSIVRGSAPGFPDVLKDQTCASFLSTDGGKNWQRHEFPVTNCADPWAVITPDGQAVVSMVAASGELAGQGSSGLVIFHSSDGGRTWDDHPVGLGRNHDHPVMTVDLGLSSRKGWVYLSSHRSIRADDGVRRYGPWIVRSRDGGKTFDDPMTVVPNNIHNFAEMPVVLADGTLVVSFVDGYYPTDRPERDGTFERRRAWIIRSTDGGYTFSVPLFANDACGPPPGFRLSALAADRSAGSFRDRLYFACREKGGGPIVINYSADRGERWSTPIALPSPDGDDSAEERIPGVAVNNAGVLAVAWIDGRSAPDHRCEEKVFMAASVDGGQTFLPAVRVSSTPKCGESTPVRSPTGGDYFGLASTPDGSFRLLWSEIRDGTSRLVSATVSVER
ncbi:MAG: exo-alpha-sialidase [Acidobacteria bacterium]|nr:exo-alpha-sialidase [Acidobacteriota bacterium]